MTQALDMIGYQPQRMTMFKNYCDCISYYKDKKILISGGIGYLGSSIINALGAIRCKITVLDIRDSVFKPVTGQIADIALKLTDIRKKDIWLEFLKDTDIIFHLAAQTSSRFANKNPVEDLEINLLPIVR